MFKEAAEEIGKTVESRRDDVEAWLERASPEEKRRLSNGLLDRMSPEDRRTVANELNEAAEQARNGTFGKCDLCDGYVEPERLVLDFTTRVCLDHYTGKQLEDLERDLELAAQIQQHLFPQWVPALDRVEIASHAAPGRIVSGDYFDFFSFRNDDQGAIIADVMGGGVPAGMLMSNLQASLRILGPEYESPGDLAGRLNELFRYNLRLIRFISLVLLAVDRENRRIRYANAGHNPPLLLRASGEICWLRPTGPAIGLMPEASFETVTVDTNPGDLLVLYTDGLVEARGADGSQFGEGGLLGAVSTRNGRSADAVLAELWNAVQHHCGGVLDDDAALLVARFV